MYNTTDYCLPGEIWKDIPGYEGIYQASSYGRIRSVHGKTTHSIRSGIRRWRGRIIKPKGINPKTGYMVTLWKDKKPKDWLVARLVGITFLGKPEDGRMTINHKDGNRFNNHVSNLEWLSLADNIRHAFENNLMSSNRPIKLIYKNKAIEFSSLAKASRYLGRNPGYISSCLKWGRKITDKSGNPVKIIS